MDAINFLIKEHDKIRRVFKELTDTSKRETTRRKMFDRLCDDLIIHETMEQKIWYPHLQNDKDFKEVIKHLKNEEKAAERAIKRIEKIKSDEKWEEKFEEFKKDVEHHASEEEQKLFPKVRTHFEASDLDQVGTKMRRFKLKFKTSKSLL